MPLIKQDITDYVSQCRMCNTHKPEQSKEPMVPYSVSDLPWAKVGADLFEPQGQHTFLSNTTQPYHKITLECTCDECVRAMR